MGLCSRNRVNPALNESTAAMPDSGSSPGGRDPESGVPPDAGQAGMTTGNGLKCRRHTPSVTALGFLFFSKQPPDLVDHL
jgi:hypothetical protein